MNLRSLTIPRDPKLCKLNGPRIPKRSATIFTGFIQCCNVTNSVVPFFPFQGFFVGATSLVPQHQLPQFLHVLTDGFICYLCNLCNFSLAIATATI
jgi:hypothetical protein